MRDRLVQNKAAIDTLHGNADYQGKTKSATVRPAKRFKTRVQLQDLKFCGGRQCG